MILVFGVTLKRIDVNIYNFVFVLTFSIHDTWNDFQTILIWTIYGYIKFLLLFLWMLIKFYLLGKKLEYLIQGSPKVFLLEF